MRGGRGGEGTEQHRRPTTSYPPPAPTAVRACTLPLQNAGVSNELGFRPRAVPCPILRNAHKHVPLHVIQVMILTRVATTRRCRPAPYPKSGKGHRLRNRTKWVIKDCSNGSLDLNSFLDTRKATWSMACENPTGRQRWRPTKWYSHATGSCYTNLPYDVPHHKATRPHRVTGTSVRFHERPSSQRYSWIERPCPTHVHSICAHLKYSNRRSEKTWLYLLLERSSLPQEMKASEKLEANDNIFST